MLISNREGPCQDPSYGAVGPDDPVLRKLGRGRLTGASPVDIVDHLLPVFLQHRIQPGARVCVQALARTTRQGLIGRADVEHLVPLRGGQPEDLLDGFGDLPEPLFVLLQPSDHRVDDAEEEDYPEEEHEKAPANRDDAGPHIGLSNLGQVNLGYDAPTQFRYGFVGRQYDGALVIYADQGPGHPGQGPAHRLGAICVKGDGTRALSLLVPVTQKERDIIPLAPGEREFTCLAEPLAAYVGVDDLAQRGFHGAARIVLLAVGRIKSGDRLDQPGLILDDLRQSILRLLERDVVQNEDRDSGDHQRDNGHDQDQNQQSSAPGHFHSPSYTRGSVDSRLLMRTIEKRTTFCQTGLSGADDGRSALTLSHYRNN